MLCLYCRQPISPVRRLWDTRFCSSEHRDQVLARSARFLREAEDLGSDDPWLEERRRGAGQRTSAVVFVMLVAIVGMGFFISSAPPPTTYREQPMTPKENAGVGNTLRTLLGRTEPLTFGDGLHTAGIWRDLTHGSDWAQEGSYVRPGRLRIWERSESLANYELAFVGQIDRKSVDWAFRVSDSQNYYATKLAILNGETSELVRYVVLDGKVLDRTELPIPVKLAANTDYMIRLSAQGSRFLTSIDGRVVSSWNDPRISRGGVGFFSEDGEKSLLKWAALSEQDSLVGKVLSHFSILVFPQPPVAATNRAVLGW